MPTDYESHWVIYTDDKQFKPWFEWICVSRALKEKRKAASLATFNKLGYLIAPNEYPPNNTTDEQKAERWFKGWYQRNGQRWKVEKE